MPHGFSGDKQVIKFQKIQEIVVEFVYLRQQNFSSKEVNYGCVSDHIVSFFDAAVTIDVFTMHNNAVKQGET